MSTTPLRRQAILRHEVPTKTASRFEAIALTDEQRADIRVLLRTDEMAPIKPIEVHDDPEMSFFTITFWSNNVPVIREQAKRLFDILHLPVRELSAGEVGFTNQDFGL